MSSTHTPPAPAPWGRTVGIGIILTVVVTILTLAFAWPAVTSTVKGVPVSVVGPEAATDAMESALTEASPNTFVFSDASDRDAAIAQINERATYGAIVLGDSPEVLTSSAASPVVSQLLTGLAPRLQAQLAAALAAQGADAAQEVTVTVTDVVPLSSNDPRGAGLTAAAFPLTLGGMLGGILASLLIVGAWRRVVAISIYSVLAGLVLGGVLQGWFGVLQGSYFANSGLIALGLLAISATIVGVSSLIGRIGIAVGPVLFLLIANPISGATAPIEFLPEPWGAVGQWLPPGASATLVRDLSYFPDAATAFPWLVLAVWAVAGVALALIGHFRAGVSVNIENEVEPVHPEDQHRHRA
jgi:hypothetical protein